MGQARVIADFSDLRGEGLLWDSRTQSLYWSDAARQRIYKYRWGEDRSEVVSDNLSASGLIYNEPGGFVVTNSEGFWLWDGKAAPVLLAARADGQPCTLRNCVAGPKGRVFAGSSRQNPRSGEFERTGCIFRLGTDGAAHVADEGFLRPGGLAFAPDGRTMYAVDSADRRIYAWDYRKNDGSLNRRRVLVQVPADEGIPDGVTVDAQGFIWCAHWFGGCVIRYNPDGKMERRMPLPASQVCSVTFGGPNHTDILVTSARQLDSQYLAPNGYDPSKYFLGGPVYHLEAGFRGLEQRRARITVERARHA